MTKEKGMDGVTQIKNLVDGRPLYMAADGLPFNTAAEAAAHQARIDLRLLCESFTHATPWGLSMWLESHCTEVFRLLGRIHPGAYGLEDPGN
jgi:hypothetical protein